MSATVTLHVFSGRPDPTWELNDRQIGELANRLALIDKTTLMKPFGIVGGLGYRGFSVETVREKDLDESIYIHLGIIDTFRFDINKRVDNSDIEEWLLTTGGDAIQQEVRTHVEEELAENWKPLASDGVHAFIVPPFDPGKWNNTATIRARNNCYNYANDKITNSFAQPGLGSGHVYSKDDCGDVGSASHRDGQIAVSSITGTPSQGHFIALVIWPNVDFHWYRLDKNAHWSHKPGSTPARNVDDSAHVISDPRTCNRGKYTVFCGFYHCIPASTRIR